MPIRIYSLAKQLKLDSKVLVDICTKAGVTGKGSALASLTDEELATVTAFMNSGKGGRPGAAPAGHLPPGRHETGMAGGAPAAFRREDYIAPAGTVGHRIAVLPPSKAEKPPALKKKPEETPSPAAAAEAPPAPPREEKEKEREHEKEERGPAIKLAPMPPTAKPPLQRKTTEPAPQKPDIKLPKDAIRAGKAGTKPLLERLEHRKHEQKRIAAEAAKGPRGKLPPEAMPPIGAPLPIGRERPRRSGRQAAVLEKEEEGAPTLGGREQRQLKRKKAATVKRRKPDEEEESSAPVARGARTSSGRAPTRRPRGAKACPSSCRARCAASPRRSACPPARFWASCWKWAR